MKNRIDELNEQIENALANDAQGEAEELYRELEDLCNELDEL
jgi:hypothetical protein